MRRHSVLAAAVLGVTGLVAGGAQAASVALSNASATFSQADFNVAAAIDGSKINNTGWAIDPNEVAQSAVFQVAGDSIGFAEGTALTFTLSQLFPSPDKHTIGKFKLSVTDDANPSVGSGATWAKLSNVAFSANPAEAAISIAADGTILLDGLNRPSTSVYTVQGITSLSSITGFRLDVLEDTSLPHDGPGRQPVNGNFVLTEFEVDAVIVPLPSAACVGLGLLGALGLGRRSRRNA